MVPPEVREALHLEAGDQLTWEVHGEKVAVTTERPAFWRWEGFIKVGPGDVVDDVAKARELPERS
jgi:bifunctional DNA-binding transcriptional regulator/antitoxin component of YhaV-PrlF toxin-antitoxin module